jgi:4-hydroxy-tetrahydrodipicolinate synthase
MMLRGSLTALVTPFDKGGRFDEKAFRACRMADR